MGGLRKHSKSVRAQTGTGVGLAQGGGREGGCRSTCALAFSYEIYIIFKCSQLRLQLNRQLKNKLMSVLSHFVSCRLTYHSSF